MADAYAQASDQAKTGEQTPQELCSYWLSNIETAERKLKSWQARGDQIIKRYKNKRGSATGANGTGIAVDRRRMNVLWSNVQTLKPTLFSRLPKPNVSRRNKDKDPVGRWASIVLERCLVNSLDMQPFDYTMEQAVEDRLLPGMANCITEYVPQVDNDQVGWQEAKTRYIHWKDQITNVSRNWSEVWYWGYKSYLTRKEVRDTVMASTGDEAKAKQISTDIVLDHKEDKDTDAEAKATVWCIWDKSTKQVLHVATGYAQAPLAVMDPPVKFDGFFPCPRPLSATTASDSTIPVPDFDQYQDQADEIDMYTQRIGILGKSLKLRGLYAADVDSIKQLMENASEADLIGVDNWAMFAERGGMKGVVEWFPLDMIANTLMQCIQAREQAIQVMYQITGISDIQRGATDASETAAAQQLKAQFGGIRVKDTQRDVQRFIRDTIRLQAEIISEHFKLPVLQKMSGVKLLTEQQKKMVQQAAQMWQQFAQSQQPPQPGQPPMPPAQPPGVPQPSEDMLDALKEPSWEQVMALLRDDKLRGFVVDVETDSTIEPDQIAEQQKAEQFLTAVAQFMTAMLPVLQIEPNLAPLVGELMMMGVRNFKAGETIETQIEEAVEALEKKAANPPPPKPTPEELQAQVDAQNNKQKMQLDTVKMQGDLAINKQKVEGDLLVQQQKLAQEDRHHAATLEHQKQQAHMDRQNQRRMAKEKPKEGDAAPADDTGDEPMQNVAMDQPDGGQAIAEALTNAAQAMAASAQATIKMGADIRQAIMAPNEIIRVDGKIVGSRKTQGIMQ